MAKIDFALLASSLVCLLLSLPAMGQTPGDPPEGLKTSFVGSNLTCSKSSPPLSERIVVPKSVEKRAKLKARLLNLLHQSLYDDSKGIVNLAREKEIASLANKLTEK